ncbi:MAG: hypothetical protein GAK41_00701 [Burkholderia gladioli]|nr:MAG: hypothetical protein GAK41_00701 [Burkholderia gladioli]
MQTRQTELKQELRNRLVSLQEQHTQLSREIELKENRSDIDDLALHRLKKEKLALLKFEWVKRAAGVRKPTSQTVSSHP